jgi:hypothetical protein
MTAIGQAVSAALIQFVWQGAAMALLLWVMSYSAHTLSAWRVRGFRCVPRATGRCCCGLRA